MQARLLPLVMTGEMNNIFPNNYSITTDIISHISNTPIQLIRSRDALHIQAFIIPTKINLSNITSFRIQIGDQIIWNIPFDIIKINNTKIIDNEYYITISDEILGFNFNKYFLIDKFLIPLLCLFYNRVEFILIAKDNNQYYNFDYKMIINNISYQTETRNTILQINYNSLSDDDQLDDNYLNNDQINNQYNKLQQCIYQYQSFPITGSTNTINPRLLMTGVYIKSLYPIIKYELMINNISYINREDYKMILYWKNFKSKRSLWTKKHSLTLEFSLNTILSLEIIDMIEEYVKDKYEYLYYFPITTFGNSTINCDKADYIKINITTENDKYDGNIYVKNLNLLNIKDGMGVVGYQ